MRPYYQVKNETWVKCFSKRYDISKPYLSVNSDYGQNISKYLKYPSWELLILYVYRSYALNSRFYNTLPKDISLICKSGMNDFNSIIENIKPKTFVKLFNYSAPISIRAKFEKSQ